MTTHSSILAWEIHGQRSLVSYGPWGHKELDMTEHTSTTTIWPLKHCAVLFQIAYSLIITAFFMVQLSSVHDCWKNHGFDYMDLC